MAITILFGKPGGGKSRFACGRIIKELRESKRNIVTNVPLNLSVLNEYLQKRWPDEDLRAVQRVRLLEESELKTFWRIRGPGVLPRMLSPEKIDEPYCLEQGMTLGQIWQAAELLKAQQEFALKARQRALGRYCDDTGDPDGKAGVAYFIDEAHIPFNARDWANIGKDALFYLSQHRKLGDVVWAITQAPGNLDKQFRSVAQDFVRCRNERLASLGMFRGRDRLTAKFYNSEPDKSSEPYRTEAFTIDPQGIGACYDTARGIGVNGNMADIGARAKGLSVYWIIPLVMLVGSLVVAVPWAFGQAAKHFVAGGKKAQSIQAAAVAVHQKQSVPPPLPVVAAADTTTNMPPEKIEVVAVVMQPDNTPEIWLSSGDVLHIEDGISKVTLKEVVMRDGQRYPVRKAVIVPVLPGNPLQTPNHAVSPGPPSPPPTGARRSGTEANPETPGPEPPP